MVLQITCTFAIYHAAYGSHDEHAANDELWIFFSEAPSQWAETTHFYVERGHFPQSIPTNNEPYPINWTHSTHGICTDNQSLSNICLAKMAHVGIITLELCNIKIAEIVHLKINGVCVAIGYRFIGSQLCVRWHITSISSYDIVKVIE